MNKVIPSIKRNKNIIPSAILSLGNKVNNDQYFQNSKLYKVWVLMNINIKFNIL